MKPQRRTPPRIPPAPASDYRINSALTRIQQQAQQSAATAQQIEERMVERANGRWEDQESIEEN